MKIHKVALSLAGLVVFGCFFVALFLRDTGNGGLDEARAYKHVEAIASSPHPRMSVANRLVRDYIVKTLKELGYDPEIQSAYITAPDGSPVLALENIVVVARGDGTSKSAVLIAAHYDSARSSPGAGDNAASVAAVLEMLERLRSRERRHNDLIILFTDGEESGLMGAKEFIRNHPRAKDVKLAFNFDARGTHGPILMFESNAVGVSLLSDLRLAVGKVTSTSIAAAVYSRMRNNTDFRIWSEKAIPGFGFAFIGGSEHYHRMSDRPVNLDKNTLAEILRIITGIAIYFGDTSLPRPAGKTAVYYNLFGKHLVILTKDCIVWLAVVSFLLMSGLSVKLLMSLGLKRCALAAVGIAAGVICCGLTLFIAVKATVGFGIGRDEILRMGICLVILVSFSTATVSLVAGFCGEAACSFAGFCILNLCSIVVGAFIPEVGYLFVLPNCMGVATAIFILCIKPTGILDGYVGLPLKFAVNCVSVMLWSPAAYFSAQALPLSLIASGAGFVIVLVSANSIQNVEKLRGGLYKSELMAPQLSADV